MKTSTGLKSSRLVRNGALALGLLAAVCAAMMLTPPARRARQVTGRLEACRALLADASDYHKVDPYNNRLETRYPRFLKKQAQCYEEYDALERGPGTGNQSRASTAALALALARHRALAVMQEHCLESILFGRGMPREYSCDSEARAMLTTPLKADLSEYLWRARLGAAANLVPRWRRRAAAVSGAPRDSGRPNIVIVLIDTLRADTLSAYGGPADLMPHLNRIARKGVVFKRATSASSTTFTSVASLFTGTDPWANNAFSGSSWTSERSLVPLFRDAGYHTIAFSNNHIVSDVGGFDRGFDEFYLRKWPPARVTALEFGAWWRHARPRSKPVFAYIQLIDPHDPYFSPGLVAELRKNPLPGNFLINPNEWRKKYIDKGLDPIRNLPAGNLAFMHHLYEEEARYVDQWLGDILQTVRESSGAQNTLVVFVADHGEQFMEHGDVKHSRQLYEPLVHVPLVLSGKLPPGLEAGTVFEHPHSTMELLPSLLAWVGGDVPQAAMRRTTLFSGRAAPAPIVSAARGLALDRSAFDQDLMSLRQGSEKLILDVTAGKYELYDLDADPGERHNLAAERPERALELVKQARHIVSASTGSAPGKNRKKNKELERRMRELGYVK